MGDKDTSGALYKDFNIVFIDHPSDPHKQIATVVYRDKCNGGECQEQHVAEPLNRPWTSDVQRQPKKRRPKRKPWQRPGRVGIFQLHSRTDRIPELPRATEEIPVLQNFVLRVLWHSPALCEFFFAKVQHDRCSRDCSNAVCVIRKFVTEDNDADMVAFARRFYESHLQRVMERSDLSTRGITWHLYWTSFLQWLSQQVDLKSMEDLCLLKVQMQDRCLSCGFTRSFSFRCASLVVQAKRLDEDLFTLDVKCLDWGQVRRRHAFCLRCVENLQRRTFKMLNSPEILTVRIINHEREYTQRDKLVLPTTEGDTVYRAFACVPQKLPHQQSEVLFFYHCGCWYSYCGKIDSIERELPFKYKIDTLLCQKVGVLKTRTNELSPEEKACLVLREEITGPVWRGMRDVPSTSGAEISGGGGEATAEGQEGQPALTEDSTGDGDAFNAIDASEDRVSSDEARMVTVKLNETMEAVALLQPWQNIDKYLKDDDGGGNSRKNGSAGEQTGPHFSRDARGQCLEESPTGNREPVPISVPGLSSAAFMVAILHIMRLSRPFRHAFMDMVRSEHVCTEPCVRCSILQMIRGRDLHEAACRIFKLVGVSPDCQSSESHDSRVFYIRLVQQIQKFVALHLFQDVFTVWVRTRISCEECGCSYTALKVLYYLTFFVNIGTTRWCLRGTVKEYFKERTAFRRCKKCRENTLHKTQSQLGKLPGNLLMCVSNKHGVRPSSIKIFNAIRVPYEDSTVRYTLYAVVYHTDDHSSGSQSKDVTAQQFTAVVKHKNVWYQICDEKILPVPWSSVSATSRVPYMMFFEKASQVGGSTKLPTPETVTSTTSDPQSTSKWLGNSTSSVPGDNVKPITENGDTNNVVVRQLSETSDVSKSVDLGKYPVISSVRSLAPEVSMGITQSRSVVDTGPTMAFPLTSPSQVQPGAGVVHGIVQPTPPPQHETLQEPVSSPGEGTAPQNLLQCYVKTKTGDYVPTSIHVAVTNSNGQATPGTYTTSMYGNSAGNCNVRPNVSSEEVPVRDECGTLNGSNAAAIATTSYSPFSGRSTFAIDNTVPSRGEESTALVDSVSYPICSETTSTVTKPPEMPMMTTPAFSSDTLVCEPSAGFQYQAGVNGRSLLPVCKGQLRNMSIGGTSLSVKPACTGVPLQAEHDDPQQWRAQEIPRQILMKVLISDDTRKARGGGDASVLTDQAVSEAATEPGASSTEVVNVDMVGVDTDENAECFVVGDEEVVTRWVVLKNEDGEQEIRTWPVGMSMIECCSRSKATDVTAPSTSARGRMPTASPLPEVIKTESDGEDVIVQYEVPVSVQSESETP